MKTFDCVSSGVNLKLKMHGLTEVQAAMIVKKIIEDNSKLKFKLDAENHFPEDDKHEYEISKSAKVLSVNAIPLIVDLLTQEGFTHYKLFI